MSSEDERFFDLSRPAFTRGMLADAERHVIEREFSSHVAEVVGRINDGKEATVYRCRTTPAFGDAEYLAAKMYRARKFRAFANESAYTNPGRMRDRRLAKAMKQRSRRGLDAAHHDWIDREWAALTALHEAGASVPTPYLHCPDGILMEYLGIDDVRAPSLAEARLSREEAERALPLVLRDVEILLDCGLVHGDLSAYNVLYHEGRPRLIDLPQAMRIEDAADGWTLFLRDVTNVCDHFSRRGVAVDGLDVAMDLWRRSGRR
jgi:RIO kinase 1